MYINVSILKLPELKTNIFLPQRNQSFPIVSKGFPTAVICSQKLKLWEYDEMIIYLYLFIY